MGGGGSESETWRQIWGRYRIKVKVQVVVRFGQRKIVARKNFCIANRQNRHFYEEYTNNDWPYAPHVDYSKECFRDDTIQKASETDVVGIPAWETKWGKIMICHRRQV